MKYGVVIPAYNVADEIAGVISSIPETINHIIVVDDKCPYSSGKIAEKINDKKIMVIYHNHNMGVGGAVITGYKKALELSCDIIIKIDGDGQMDPQYIDKLIQPLIEDRADLIKR